MTFSFLAICGLSPLALIRIIYGKRRRELVAPNFTESYGVIVRDQRLNTRVGVYWKVLVLARWILTTGVIIALRELYSI